MNLLRDRRLAALLAAEVVSSVGTQMTWLALPWFVLRTTGSAQRMSWVLIAEIAPIALTGLRSGAVVRRIGSRRTMLLADALRIPLFAAIPALHAAGLLAFPVLLALVAASGVFLAPYWTVQRTIVPELVGEEQGDVATAMALFQAANRSAIFVGPLLAGVLISLMSAANVLYIDAATYLVSVALVAAFVRVPQVAAPDDPKGVRDGLRFILGDSLLRVWVPSLTLVDVCWTAFFACLPVLVVARFHAHPQIYGSLMGGLGGGALVGAFVALRFVRNADPLTMTATCFICQVTALWLVALPLAWPVAVAGMAGAGFFMSLVNSPMQALMMLRMPRDVRTHAMAVSGVLSFTLVPVGLLVVGWTLAHHSPRAVIGVVIAVQTAAILSVVIGALSERSALRAAAVDSPA